MEEEEEEEARFLLVGRRSCNHREAINLVAAIFSHLRSPANCGRAGDTRGKGGEGRRSIVEGRSIAEVYIYIYKGYPWFYPRPVYPSIFPPIPIEISPINFNPCSSHETGLPAFRSYCE